MVYINFCVCLPHASQFWIASAYFAHQNKYNVHVIYFIKCCLFTINVRDIWKVKDSKNSRETICLQLAELTFLVVSTWRQVYLSSISSEMCLYHMFKMALSITDCMNVRAVHWFDSFTYTIRNCVHFGCQKRLTDDLKKNWMHVAQILLVHYRDHSDRRESMVS